MLRNIFDAAVRAVDGYTDRVAEASLCRHSDLIVELEQLLADATRLRNEIGKIRSGESQVGVETQLM
jgi:hypothetical protein